MLPKTTPQINTKNILYYSNCLISLCKSYGAQLLIGSDSATELAVAAAGPITIFVLEIQTDPAKGLAALRTGHMLAIFSMFNKALASGAGPDLRGEIFFLNFGFGICELEYSNARRFFDVLRDSIAHTADAVARASLPGTQAFVTEVPVAAGAAIYAVSFEVEFYYQ